jgi:guanylate kinase
MTSDTIAKLARAGKHLAFYINIDGTRDVKKRIEEVNDLFVKENLLQMILKV